MSHYYQCKLLSDKIITPTGSEMISLIPVDFDWREEFLLDIKKTISGFEEFYATLKEFINQNGTEKALANFYQSSFFSPCHYKHLSELLFKDLAKELKTGDCFHLEGYYFGNNLMAELMPDHFKLASLRQLSIDVVTVNPDAGFPENHHLLNKDLCIRILADLEGTDNSKLYQWFDNLKTASFYEPNFGGVGECVYAIIVGAKRRETINLEVEKPEFWDRYRNKWWAELLKDELTRDSDNKPYQAVNFLIHLHPSWLNEKLSDRPFNSWAYAVSY